MTSYRRLFFPIVALALGACSADSDDDDVASEPDPVEQIVPASTDPNRASALSADMTWQWQLQGEVNTSYDADVYDIDLFDTPSSVIGELHAADRVVICYFSAGSYEEWRDDASDFAESDLGEPLDGWEGERWVDVRSQSVRSLIENRLDLAVERGCDGVEPDNVTAYSNDSGFDITNADQLSFNTFLADSAHDRGLLVGLKNDLDQIPDLAGRFDFAVNEECLEYEECDVYGPFIDAGKPVFGAEYSADAVEDPEATCVAARAAGLTTLILPLDLDDSFRISCHDQL